MPTTTAPTATRKGRLMMILAVVLFVAATEAKKTCLLKEERGTAPVLVCAVPAVAEAEHYVETSAEARLGRAPNLDALVDVTLNGTRLAGAPLTAAAMEGDTETGVSASKSFYVTPATSGTLTVTLTRRSGDKGEIRVYRGLLPGMEIAPALAIFLGIWGLVRYLRSGQ